MFKQDVQTKTNFPILMNSLHNRHQHYIWLFPAMVTSSSHMVTSTKTVNFLSATVYEINRGNQHSKKEKYPYSEDVNMQ